MLRRSRRVQLFLSKNSTGTICIAWLHLQEGHFIFICFAPLHVHPCPCNVRISTEYLYSEHALKVRWMHSHPTAGKINPNHAPKSLFSLSMEMSRLTRDGTAEPVSRDQILRHVRGQGNVHFPCSADHEQDWQPYPVDPYSAI